MNRRHRVTILALYLALPLTLCVALDQALKALAQQQLRNEPPILLFGGIVELWYGRNPGAFLGLGAELPAWARFWLFTILVGIGLAVVLIVAIASPHLTRSLALGVALTVGGGLGNFIDRLRFDGAVIDYIRIGIGRLRTGVFNLADVALIIGLVLIARQLGEDEEHKIEPPAR
jgi:signal peptidase II